ncbi:hypothetical protein SDC9_159254 [bioreactor metagenome]|uniref:Uncharacterized protein n=1 Tax=bioreactor metagenome TaxID=1076179 RepID=A0A645FC45_9ZZZZ
MVLVADVFSGFDEKLLGDSLGAVFLLAVFQNVVVAPLTLFNHGAQDVITQIVFQIAALMLVGNEDAVVGCHDYSVF